MKIRPGGPADGQMDRHVDRRTVVTKLIALFRVSTNAPKNGLVERKMSFEIHSSSAALFAIFLLQRFWFSFL